MRAGYDFFHDLWKEVALANAYQQQEGNYVWQQVDGKGAITIACLPLSHYKPEEISVDVDSGNLTLRGQHIFEREDGFDKTEFMRVFKLPQGVDPTTVTSRITQDGGALVIEGFKRVEENGSDGKFEAKLDVRGFKPDEIKIRIRGNELTVTGKHITGQRSRDYARRILLPSDINPSSVTSRLSKEGVLTIEASRDPAFLQCKRSVKVIMETEEASEEAKQAENADAEQIGN